MARPAIYTKWLEGDVTASFSGPSADAFGRLRTSDPHIIFDSQNQYNTSPLLFNSQLTTGGTITHLPNESTAAMNVTATTGSEVIRQSKRYFRYQPGRSLHIFLSFKLETAKTGLRQRIGFFDANNGVYLQLNDSTVSFIRRTYVGGSTDDTSYKVDQANWNVDKLDGTGPSGVTLDLSKVQLLFMDLQWLGVGRVRIGFVIGDEIIIAHEFFASNILTSVYMTSANLPVRAEITNTGSASTSQLKFICCALASEGGEHEAGYQFSASSFDPSTPSSTGTAINTNSEIPVLGIRLKTTFNSITNRGIITLRGISFICLTRKFHASVLLRPASTTGGSWVSVDNDSIVEYNRGITSFTTDANTKRPISELTDSSSQLAYNSENDALRRLEMGLDIAGTTSDVLLVTAGRLEANNTTVWSTLTWWENY
jgi:hypothetical protein